MIYYIEQWGLFIMENYKEIKNKVIFYTTLINKIKYEGYEKDIHTLKELCNAYYKVKDSISEKNLLDYLTRLDKIIEYQSFVINIKKDNMMQIIYKLWDIASKSLDKEKYFTYLDNLAHDYIMFNWHNRHKKDIDSDIVITIMNFYNRLDNISNIINIELNKTRKL